MKYKILRFNEIRNYFELSDPDGHTHRVDLFVNASYSGFGNIKNSGIDKWREKMNSFAGKFVEIDSLRPYEEIAYGVRLLK